MDELPPNRPRRAPWLAITAIVIVGILAAAFVYVARLTLAVPGDVARSGREVLSDVERIARAFREGTVTTSFVSFATEITGTNRLQFATLTETEVFERKDTATTFWGRFELPELVVRATAPVTYTYYLDLEGDWGFRLEDRTVTVVAPPIRFNKPAIDASRIRYEVREESLWRDEEEAIRILKEELTGLSFLRARENVELVREVGRRKVEEFVRTWFVRRFDGSAPYDIEVHFQDELPSLPLETLPDESRLGH